MTGQLAYFSLHDLSECLKRFEDNKKHQHKELKKRLEGKT